MKRVAALLLLVAASQAHAWESQCRNSAFSTFAESVCAPIGTPECAGGVAIARGHQQGEHAQITDIGMRWAGLRRLASAEQSFSYYTNGATTPVFGTPLTLPTAVPAGTGGMLRKIDRTFKMAELAQAADGSYSFTDFLMGNEHCVVPHIPNSTVEEVHTCHVYSKHLASVNSIHFSPQNRAVYELYHELALATARRCRQICGSYVSNACSNLVGNPFIDKLTESVRACDVEAVALEAVASHFLADAWSTGHMWQRWGTPVVPASLTDQVRLNLVGLVSGLIHGWRSVVRGQSFVGPYEHDQLCMTGPSGDYPSPDDTRQVSEIVHWVAPNGDVQPGGGDFYLLECNQRERKEGRSSDGREYATHQKWAVAPSLTNNALGEDFDTTRLLGKQYQRMIGCVAKGFDEVLTAGAGTLHRDPDELQLLERAGIPSSTDASCWNQRVTNNSMVLGAGLTYLGGTFGDLSVLGKLSVDLLPTIAEIGQAPGLLTLLRTVINPLTPALRAEMIDLTVEFARVNRGYTADGGARVGGPAGTELANLETTRSFLDVKRNEEALPDVRNDRVAFLERRAVQTPDGYAVDWSHSAAGTCTTDANCTASDRRFCDPTHVANGTLQPTCVEHDVIIPRAFRLSEMAHFCMHDKAEELERARINCEDPMSDACLACVEALAPHVRAGCSASTWKPRTLIGSGGSTYTADNRSMCDVLKDLGVIPASADLDVNSLYLPAGATNSSVVMDLCLQSQSLCQGPDCSTCAGGQQCCERWDCAGEDGCPGVCTGVGSDAYNCGACGNACAGGRGCCNGVCEEPLHPLSADPSRYIESACCGDNRDQICTTVYVKQYVPESQERMCGGADGGVSKVNVTTDRNHCGFCGNVCGAGQECCGGGCVDTQTNKDHCGSCGNECGGPSAMCCNGSCLGHLKVPEHCAGCNTPCGTGFFCGPRAGCIPDGTGDYGNTCRPEDAYPIECGFYCWQGTEDEVCGSCGTACVGTSSCCGGACVASDFGGPRCDTPGDPCGQTCAQGDACCDGSCVSPATARAFGFCGGCHTYCNNDETCCDDACTRVFFDNANCGSCGNACQGEATCCYGGCLDTLTDEQHCGACGQACKPGEQCCRGTCVRPDGGCP